MPGVAVKGKIVRGIGVAVHTVALQAPHLRAWLPEIDRYHPATINLRLERPVAILEPDVRTPPLVWLTSVPPEVFSFVKVELQPLREPPAAPVEAHIYQAHLSPHLADPYVVELLAPLLDLDGVTECVVRFPRPVREVPFIVV